MDLKPFPDKPVFNVGDRIMYQDAVGGYVKEVGARGANWQYGISLDDGNWLTAYGEYKLKKIDNG